MEGGGRKMARKAQPDCTLRCILGAARLQGPISADEGCNGNANLRFEANPRLQGPIRYQGEQERQERPLTP